MCRNAERKRCFRQQLTLQAGHAQRLIPRPRDLLVHVRAQLGLLRGGHLKRQRGCEAPPTGT